jgi:hypothetical protein
MANLFTPAPGAPSNSCAIYKNIECEERHSGWRSLRSRGSGPEIVARCGIGLQAAEPQRAHGFRKERVIIHVSEHTMRALTADARLPIRILLLGG